MVGIPQNKNITLGKPVLCMSLSMHLRRQKEKYRKTVVKTDAVVIFCLTFQGCQCRCCFSVSRLYILKDPLSCISAFITTWAMKISTGCVGYIGDYTTQLGADYNKPLHYKDPYIKQPICHENSGRFLFFPLLKCCRRSTKRCDVTMATLQVKWKPWHKHSVPWDHGVERWKGIGWLVKIW